MRMVLIRTWRWTSVLAAGAVLAAAGCGGTDQAPESAPGLVATTGVWADVTSHVACGEDVAAVIPPDGDPHTFEASLRDRGRLEAADLVVANGAGLEQQLTDLIDTVAGDGVPVVAVADHVDLIVHDDAGSDHDAATGEHHDEGADPHLWQDPTLVAGAVDAIADALVAAGRDANEIESCAAAYRDELLALDAEIAERLTAIPPANRLLVTNHDSLAYFADRYDLELIGSVIPSTSTIAEPSAAELAELADLIGQRGIPAIFVETSESSVDARALADRLGVDVVELSTGSVGGEAAESYVAMMRDNAAAITAALSP